MIISAIVARSSNNVIGKDNQIPWYLPADLKYFKKTTLNSHLIMGRKCYESIGKPLPKRVNIVITRQKGYDAPGCIVVHSLEKALKFCGDSDVEKVFIIGGAEIYKLSQPFWHKLYITEVDAEVEGDVYFPEMEGEWEETWQEKNYADDRNEFDHTFRILSRKKESNQSSDEIQDQQGKNGELAK